MTGTPIGKLSVRIIPRGAQRIPHLALCDEAGNPLPGQRHVAISQQYLRGTEVTVTFVLDGDKVCLSGG